MCEEFKYYPENKRFSTDQLREELVSKNVRVIDLTEKTLSALQANREKEESLYIACNRHFNAKGNSFIANLIFNNLKNVE